MLAFLSYTYASCDSEDVGTALVDTAAQHGLIGRETLARRDQYFQQRLQLRVQYSDEQGGTVRGVCGSEEVTQVAYIPIGLGGRAGILRADTSWWGSVFGSCLQSSPIGDSDRYVELADCVHSFVCRAEHEQAAFGPCGSELV